jgi:integrase
MLIGCGLRRAEIVAVKIEDLKLREDHWVLADLVGKGGHVRTVPLPDWVKSAVDSWLSSAALHGSVLFRSVSKTGKVWGSGFTAKVIWSIVRGAASDCGFCAVAPHDLRRTCARLCHQAGGELEQIQFLLGHVSVQITLTNGHQPLSV